MDNVLEFRELDHPFDKVNKRGRKNCTYYDSINNNLILFTPYDDCDVESVCNGIRNSMYLHLIEVLNINENVLVWWSQVQGTTSDYTIYYDMPINELKNKKHKEIIDYLANLKHKRQCGYKYTEVRDGIEYKIAEKEYDDINSVYVVKEEYLH